MAVFKRAIQEFKRGVKARKVAHALVKQARERVDELDWQVAALVDKTVDRLKQNIEEERLPVEPLSPEYLAWKKRMGKDERVFIADGEYLDAIEARRERPMLYAITVADRTHHSGLPMRLLSRILEHGTVDGIPARPHFGPARREATRELEVLLRRFNQESRIAAKRNRVVRPKNVKRPRAE